MSGWSVFSHLITFCGRPDMDKFRQEKIQRFEEFVDLRLKPDLVRAIGERYGFDSVMLTELYLLPPQTVFTYCGSNYEICPSGNITHLFCSYLICSESLLQLPLCVACGMLIVYLLMVCLVTARSYDK